MVVYGNETEKIKLMTIEKKYKHVALMSDGHCQSWTDLALLNLGLKRSAPACGAPELQEAGNRHGHQFRYMKSISPCSGKTQA